MTKQYLAATALFFLFSFFVQDVMAIAVTPPSLKFDGNVEKTFMVFNTNDFETDFMISVDNNLIFSQKEFTLGKKGSITISTKPSGLSGKKGTIYIKESVPDSNGLRLENGIGMKYDVTAQEQEITGYSIKNISSSKYIRYIVIVMLAVAILFAIFYKNDRINRVFRK